MKIITWDYKEQPNVEKINEALGELLRPKLFSVQTESDEFAIVVAEDETSQEAAQRAYDLRNEYDPHEFSESE